MENTKNIEFSAQDAEYIAEALNEAIEEADNIGTDNEVYNRAPRMRNILTRIIDRYELPDPWSDRPDTEARRKVAEKSPGFDEYIKRNGVDMETEVERKQRERREREERDQADIDAARTVLNKYWKTWGDCMPGEGCEIIECIGPDQLGYTMRPDAERGSELPFAVAYMTPWKNGQKIEEYERREVRGLVAWVNLKTQTCRYEYEEDMPSIHFPPSLLGFLTPVPEYSSAYMWRELNRRYWTNLMLCGD